MTFIETWIRSPFSEAMAWTLFHFLWQGLIAAAMLATALCIVRSARSRYTISCLAMLGMALSFAATFVYYVPWAEVSGAAAVAIDIKSPPDILAVPKVPPGASPLRFEAVLPWAVPFWLAGVLICTLRHLAGSIASRRIRRKGVCNAPEFWRERLTALGARLRVSRPVTLLESCFAEVPVVIGHVRPVVLMPAGLLAGLPTVQIEALLLHELAHIRRCDYLTNLFQRLVECVLFYHPAVWWISGVIREERENCCDDIVVAMNGNAKEYARALTALEQQRSHAPGALAATGGSLVKRIRRMLCPTEGTEGVNTVMTPVLSSAILLISAIIAGAGLQPLTSRAALAPAIATRSISAEARLAQASNIQASASAVVAPIVSKAPPAPQAPQISSSFPKSIGREAKYLPTAQEGVFQRWLDEDARYIITEEERLTFRALGSNEEREQFIWQFWLRRDPTPSTPLNEFRDEHYRRIVYANQRFATASVRPGWATDRGAVHIVYGPPNEIESHNVRPGGTGPYELWRYRYIEGMGTDVIFEFSDLAGTGDFRLVGQKPDGAVERVLQRLNARIDAVWVAGNRRIPTETILVNLQTKPGRELDPAVIAKDVKVLMALGFFEGVTVRAERSPNGGPIVIFNVREAPIVLAIEYKGFRSVTMAEINQKLSEAKGALAIERPYSAAKGTETADVLKTLMVSKGFSNVTVEVATEPIPPNAVRVIFVVNEIIRFGFRAF